MEMFPKFPESNNLSQIHQRNASLLGKYHEKSHSFVVSVFVQPPRAQRGGGGGRGGRLRKARFCFYRPPPQPRSKGAWHRAVGGGGGKERAHESGLKRGRGPLRDISELSTPPPNHET